MRIKSAFAGVLFYLAGMISCSSLNVFMTEAIVDFKLPIIEVIFVRQVVILLCLLPLMIKKRFDFLSKEGFKDNFLRNAVLSFSTFLIYVGMSRVPLNDATAIAFLMPIFASFLARKLLKEKAQKTLKYACLFGIIGVLVVKQPSFSGNGALIGYGALLLYSFVRAYVVILDKRLTGKFTPMTMMFYSCIIMCIVYSFFAFSFVAIPPKAIKYIAISGLLFFLEYYCLFSAYKRCQAVSLQPLEFSKLFFTMILSFIFLGQVVNWHQIVGGGIIIFGYLMVIFEKKLKAKEER